LLLVLIGVFVLAGSSAAMAAQETQPQTTAEVAAEAEHDEGHSGIGAWVPTFWKFGNFVLLAGALVYFLRSPIVGYLKGRAETIRRDLVDARRQGETAEQQLAEVREKLQRLPAELEALRVRGAEELEGERVRMQDETARERERLLDRTKKDIDLRFRLARRELTTHTAELAMRLARVRIEQTMTPEDQARLIDRYATEVHA
jgi:F-type H+-transporting ATPase subunit b